MSDPRESDEMPWLRALAEDFHGDPGAHPDPERLLAYHEGELTPEEAEELRDHLAGCPDCTGVVLDFARMAQPASEDALSETETAALWPQVREPLRQEGILAGAPRPAPASARTPWLLAATLGAAVIGLSLWAAALQRENQALRGPRTNIHIVDLLPVAAGAASREDGGGVPGERVDAPASAESVLLVLNTADLRPFPHYALEVRAPEDDRLLWSTNRIARSPRGNFTLEIPPGAPGDGRYRLLLFGIDGDYRVPLAEYRTKIRNER